MPLRYLVCVGPPVPAVFPWPTVSRFFTLLCTCKKTNPSCGWPSGDKTPLNKFTHLRGSVAFSFEPIYFVNFPIPSYRRDTGSKGELNRNPRLDFSPLFI